MKTFRIVKSYFASAGINSYQTTQWHLFNKKNALFFLMLSVNLALTCMHSAQKDETFEDYVGSFFWITTTFANAISFLTFLWKMPPLYTFFTDLEHIIKKRS